MDNVPPVDRTAVELTTKTAPTEDYREINPATGQQKSYLVLTSEERAKGFVRPVRKEYTHIGVRPKHPLRDLTDEEKEQYKEFGYIKFELYPPEELPVTGSYWSEKRLKSGCGGVTRMGQALAETYARDPGFYGGTFCVHCKAHYPVEEFVWKDTIERVGS